MTRAIPRKRRTQARRRDNTPLIIGGVIVAVVVVVLLVFLNVNTGSTPTVVGGAEGKTWGQASAPVTIDMWSDFQ